MKWPKDQQEIYKVAILELLESWGKTAEEVWKAYSFDPPMRVMYAIDRVVTYDLQHPDSHLAYSDFTDHEGTVLKARIRRCRYNPDFVLYPPGCNDEHRKTMLRSVGKEIGLIR